MCLRCRRLILGALLTIVLLAFAVRADAGQAQTSGSIVGRVTDESGAVLPGVTVTAKSPALQVQQVSDVSDGQGDYRLTPLPIGTYEVSYSLSGFQTVRRDTLRLTAGFVARVDVVLKVGALGILILFGFLAPSHELWWVTGRSTAPGSRPGRSSRRRSP